MRKTFSIILLTYLSTLATADTITLGEYKGELTGVIQYTVPGQSAEQKLSSCKAAFNFDFTANAITIPFSNYECNDAILSDPELTLTKTIDGAFEFSSSSESIAYVEVNASKSFCGFHAGLNKVPYKLNRSSYVRVKQLDEKTFSFVRQTASDKIYMVAAKLDPNNCEQVKSILAKENIVGSTARQISGVVTK